jgi:hypothetical protein
MKNCKSYLVILSTVGRNAYHHRKKTNNFPCMYFLPFSICCIIHYLYSNGLASHLWLRRKSGSDHLVHNLHHSKPVVFGRLVRQFRTKVVTKDRWHQNNDFVMSATVVEELSYDFSRGGHMSLWKNSPKYSPAHFCPNYLYICNFYVPLKKVAQKFWLLVQLKKYPKYKITYWAKIRPIWSPWF